MTTQQPPFYGHYTGQPASAGTSSQEMEDFAGSKVLLPSQSYELSWNMTEKTMAVRTKPLAATSYIACWRYTEAQQSVNIHNKITSSPVNTHSVTIDNNLINILTILGHNISQSEHKTCFMCWYNEHSLYNMMLANKISYFLINKYLSKNSIFLTQRTLPVRYTLADEAD